MAMSAADVIDILDALSARGISVSIAGGWAVDALLGRQTRDHGDLDLAIDAEVVDDAIGVLAACGLREVVDQRPARVELSDGRRTVDLHPVAWGADGIGRQEGLRGEVYEYPLGSTDATGAIEERDVQCLTPELLVRFHEGYEPRDVDRKDMSALAARFGVQLPAAYRDEAKG